jgi:hypothetical protein
MLGRLISKGAAVSVTAISVPGYDLPYPERF